MQPLLLARLAPTWYRIIVEFEFEFEFEFELTRVRVASSRWRSLSAALHQ